LSQADSKISASNLRCIVIRRHAGLCQARTRSQGATIRSQTWRIVKGTPVKGMRRGYTATLLHCRLQPKGGNLLLKLYGNPQSAQSPSIFGSGTSNRGSSPDTVNSIVVLLHAGTCVLCEDLAEPLALLLIFRGYCCTFLAPCAC